MDRCICRAKDGQEHKQGCRLRPKEPPTPLDRAITRAIQMAFEDVVELEPMPGDADYTAWLAAGRPKLDRAKRRTSPTTGVDTQLDLLDKSTGCG